MRDAPLSERISASDKRAKRLVGDAEVGSVHLSEKLLIRRGFWNITECFPRYEYCHSRGRGFEARRPRRSFHESCTNFIETNEGAKGCKNAPCLHPSIRSIFTRVFHDLTAFTRVRRKCQTSGPRFRQLLIRLPCCIPASSIAVATRMNCYAMSRKPGPRQTVGVNCFAAATLFRCTTRR